MDETISARALVQKASQFASDAFDAFQDGRADAFALQAGTSFEALIKALLAQAHPTLLVELSNKKDHESLLHLAGVRKSNRLRTVGMGEAIERLLLVHPELNRHKNLFQAIVDQRNAAAHMAVAAGQMFGSLVSWIKATNELLGVLSTDSLSVVSSADRADEESATASQDEGDSDAPDLFWSDIQLVNEALKTYKSEVEAEVQTRLVGARKHFRRWRANIGLQTGNLEEFALRTLDDNETTVRCPVCSLSGIVRGEVVNVLDQLNPVHLLFADSFRCGICRLSLMGVDELLAAGLDAEYPLPWLDEAKPAENPSRTDDIDG